MRGSQADSASAGADSTKAAPKISTMASRYAPDGRPLGPEEVMDGICPDFMADVDIWHIGDERLQSVQMIRANRDRNQTYTSVVHLEGSGSSRVGPLRPAHRRNHGGHPDQRQRSVRHGPG